MQKISSLVDLINKPIKSVTFDIKSKDQLEEISKLLDKNGDTQININFNNDNKSLRFQLENKRNIDRKTLNILRNREILSIIN